MQPLQQEGAVPPPRVVFNSPASDIKGQAAATAISSAAAWKPFNVVTLPAALDKITVRRRQETVERESLIDEHAVGQYRSRTGSSAG